MDIVTQSKGILVGIGALLFVLGGLLSFALVQKPETAREVPIVAEDDAEELPAYVAQERTYLSRVTLPAPVLSGGIGVSQALNERRSRREFSKKPLALADLSQMLWAGQGVTGEDGKRTAPSGHSIYPATIFVAVESAEGVPAGLYEYLPETHELGLLQEGSVMDSWDAITGQPHPKNAPVTLFLNGNVLKPAESYGREGGARVTYLELGHIGQNLYLQAEALGLAMVTMGGLDAEAAREFLGTTEYDEVLYLVPIGYRSEATQEEE